MSTAQAVTNDLNKVQQAAALWVPTMTTSGNANFVSYGTTPFPSVQEKSVEAKPLKPLEWLDAQVNEVLAFAIP